MKLEYFEVIEDESIRKQLWAQNVSLDDYDFVLITEDVEQFEPYVSEDYPERTRLVRPLSWTLARILESCACYDAPWYRVALNGKDVVIGLAYHS